MPNWKKLIVSGSDASLNSLIAPSITGSLQGNADTATTASYALNIGTVNGYSFTQSTPSSTWVITHNLDNWTPVVQVYDENYKVILPNEIESIDQDTTVITFTYGQSGYVNVTSGDGYSRNTIQTASYALQAATASYALNVPTSSVSSSYALTASYVETSQTASYFLTSSVSTASFVATASWSRNSLTASYFLTSSVSSASFSTKAVTADTASYVQNAISSSFAITASYALNGGGGTSVTISETVPTGSNITTGSLWFNSDTTNLYINYNDGDSSQWVGISSTGVVNSSSYAATASVIVSQEWTDAGTITIQGTTTNPTKGTIVYDKVRYRNINSTTYEVEYMYAQSTSGIAGSGDYLFSLPTGITWGAGVLQTTSATYETIINRIIIAKANWGDSGGRLRIAGVVPYDSTRFRILMANSDGSGTILSSTFAATGGSGLAIDGLTIKLGFYTTV